MRDARASALVCLMTNPVARIEHVTCPDCIQALTPPPAPSRVLRLWRWLRRRWPLA